jgi:hypothetical protein
MPFRAILARGLSVVAARPTWAGWVAVGASMAVPAGWPDARGPHREQQLGADDPGLVRVPQPFLQHRNRRLRIA